MKPAGRDAATAGFVGRAGELARLLSCSEAAALGNPQVVAVVGPAGPTTSCSPPTTPSGTTC